MAKRKPKKPPVAPGLALSKGGVTGPGKTVPTDVNAFRVFERECPDPAANREWRDASREANMTAAQAGRLFAWLRSRCGADYLSGVEATNFPAASGGQDRMITPASVAPDFVAAWEAKGSEGGATLGWLVDAARGRRGERPRTGLQRSLLRGKPNARSFELPVDLSDDEIITFLFGLFPGKLMMSTEINRE